MNSLVLKPCRWVVFLAVITCGTPWPSDLVRSSGLPRKPRGWRREAWETLRAAGWVWRTFFNRSFAPFRRYGLMTALALLRLPATVVA